MKTGTISFKPRLRRARTICKLPLVNSAILVAAGKGARMGAGVDKLFLEVAGRPVVAHTWRRFDEAPCIGEIILVVRRGKAKHLRETGGGISFPKTVPDRGRRRGTSGLGLEWLAGVSAASEIVAIHDAARPCTSGELIAATVRGAEENGAAVAAQPVTDTIKESADGRFIPRTLDRSRLWSVQTPQTFRVEVIRRALTGCATAD